MTTTTHTTAPEAAAAWWAEQVGAPLYRNVDQSSSREEREAGGFAAAMQSTIAARHPVDNGAGQKFTTALSARIEKMLGRVNHVQLGVDYGPDAELAESAEEAGIHLSRFPWKTHMSITGNYVTASLGYRAPSRLVWQHPDWQRPQCHSRRYDDVALDIHPDNQICTKPKFHDGDCGDWQTDTARCGKCGGTYVDHYGDAGWKKRREVEDFHSYAPEEESC